MSSRVDSPLRTRAAGRRSFFRLTALCTVLSAAVALGYVLPGGSILRRMGTVRDELNLSSVRVEGSTSFFGPALRDAASALGLPSDRPEVQTDAAVLLKSGGRCRFELSPLEGAREAVISTEGGLRREGRELQALDVALGQICAVLGIRPNADGEAREAVLRDLREHKIDPGTTSLARFGGKVAYVLGNPAEGQPQFWVYKDTFLPARVRISDGQVLWDVRFVDYASPASGESFPRIVEVYKGTELAMRFTALKADPRASLPDKLFQAAPASGAK